MNYIKDYIYGAIVVALISVFAWYSHHERVIGASKIQAADAKAAAAAVIHKGEVETRAQKLTDAALAAYKATLVAPPAGDAPRLRCYAAKSTGRLPANDSAGSADHARPGLPVPGAQGFDPGPAVDKITQDADAHVRVLEQYIRDCQAIGVCKQ